MACPNSWWVTPLVSFLVASITSFIAFLIAERRLKEENKLHNATEKVIKKLLKSKSYEWRSFNQLKYHIGGYDADEDSLRKLLVRSGAVRTIKSGKEYWGLIDKVSNSTNDGFLKPGTE